MYIFLKNGLYYLDSQKFSKEGCKETLTLSEKRSKSVFMKSIIKTSYVKGLNVGFIPTFKNK